MAFRASPRLVARTMENHTAHDLNVELPIADRADRGLAYQGKRLGQQLIELFSLGSTVLEFTGERAQFAVRQRLHVGL